MAEASTTTVRTVITGPSKGSGQAVREDAAAGLLNGFEGVALDPQAEAEIARALEACAARTREADAAYVAGGEAAADAAEGDPGEPFFQSSDPFRGELLPPTEIEEFVPFTPDEPHWTLAGAEKPEALIAFEEEQARRHKSGS